MNYQRILPILISKWNVSYHLYFGSLLRIYSCPFLAQWKLYYSAREVFGPLVGHLHPTDSLNATFWHKLTEVFETNDNAFQLYIQHMSRGADNTICTDACKNTTICDIRALRYVDLDKAL